MGTNYDAVRMTDRACPHCLGTGKEMIHTHIGKSSYGWTFTFHAASTHDLYPNGDGTGNIESYAEWIEYLKKPGIRIIDEYDQELSLDEFMAVVESKRNAANNHAVTMHTDLKYSYIPREDNFTDAEGNSFTRGDFC